MSNATILETPVVVCGGGPIGMLFALRLAQLGVQCLLAEQNTTTSNLPKMDVTNIRTMEILRAMGLAEGYRQFKPVEELSDWVTPFTTGMGPKGHHLFTWPLEGNKTWRNRITNLNDGTQPIEPPFRGSQIAFEAYLKDKCLNESLITHKFGWKFISCIEDEAAGVITTFVSLEGTKHTVKSQYLIGSDGGRSAVRDAVGIKTSGVDIPIKLYLTFFKSNELAERRHFGNFWHIVTPKGFVVDTNAGNLFASHHIFPEGMDISNLDPAEVVHDNLGGIGAPWKVKIDEVLVHSVWQPRFRCADVLSTPSGKSFLVGDSAHAVPPHGGHSLNTGVLGMFNLSWKIAAVVKGYGGSHLLNSYNAEMRPIAVEILDAVNGHIGRQMPWSTFTMGNADIIDTDTVEAKELRSQVGAMIRDIGNQGKYYGRELDQRFKSEVIVPDSDGTNEPPWNALQYTPTTWPGARAPHVWLKDGPTAIFDHYGLEWTLVSFHESEKISDGDLDFFLNAAAKLGMPLKSVLLVGESHARKIWERDFVLVRPDGHVAWRADKLPPSTQITEILDIVTGRKPFASYEKISRDHPLFGVV